MSNLCDIILDRASCLDSEFLIPTEQFIEENAEKHDLCDINYTTPIYG